MENLEEGNLHSQSFRNHIFQEWVCGGKEKSRLRD